jgi:amidohydrolase
MKITETRKKEIIGYRRTIHSFPELMFQERATAELVSKHLETLGFKYESGIASTGIACLIDSGLPGKTLLVRADMDALPIHEENSVEYASKVPGVMHACGHDGHTAMLMGLASEIKEDLKSFIPKGRVLLIFQPAEEGGGGADRMVESGILEKYKVDAALALHVWNHIDLGKVGVVNGPMMASVDEFQIIVKGKSGHGAMPQYTADPIVISAQIITALQTIVSRNVDPLEACVVTVGSIHSGDAFNVIPEIATLKGTVRTYSKTLHDTMEERLTKIVQGIAISMGGYAEVKYEKVNRPTINNPKMADIVRKAALQVLGENGVTEEGAQTMGGEDFSAFLDKVPGCYFFIGSRNHEKGFVKPHHNSKFDFDEDALGLGLSVMKEAIQIYLSEN